MTDVYQSKSSVTFSFGLSSIHLLPDILLITLTNIYCNPILPRLRNVVFNGDKNVRKFYGVQESIARYFLRLWQKKKKKKERKER